MGYADRACGPCRQNIFASEFCKEITDEWKTMVGHCSKVGGTKLLKRCLLLAVTRAKKNEKKSFIKSKRLLRQRISKILIEDFGFFLINFAKISDLLAGNSTEFLP